MHTRLTRAAAILLLILIATLLAGCSTAPNRPLFVLASQDANGDGQFDDKTPGEEAPAIYQLQVNGDALRLGKLTDPTQVIPRMFSVSPDGKRLAYATRAIQEGEVGEQTYLVDLTRALPPNQLPYDANQVQALYWSRDSQNLAVVATNSVGIDEVLIASPQGVIERKEDVALFAENEIQDYSPLVAPDLSRRLWPQAVSGGFQYTLTGPIDRPQSGDPLLTEYPMNFISWSPDSQRLLLSQTDPKMQDQFGTLPVPHGALFTIQPDGSRLEGITSQGGASNVAVWSPDGKTVAYLTSLEDTDNDGIADTRSELPLLYLLGQDGKAQRITLREQYKLGWLLGW